LYLNLTTLTTTARKTSLRGLKNFILVLRQGNFSMVETYRVANGDIKMLIKSVLRGKRRGVENRKYPLSNEEENVIGILPKLVSDRGGENNF